jgi:hypothetical protein
VGDRAGGHRSGVTGKDRAGAGAAGTTRRHAVITHGNLTEGLEIRVDPPS